MVSTPVRCAGAAAAGRAVVAQPEPQTDQAAAGLGQGRELVEAREQSQGQSGVVGDGVLPEDGQQGQEAVVDRVGGVGQGRRQDLDGSGLDGFAIVEGLAQRVADLGGCGASGRLPAAEGQAVEQEGGQPDAGGRGPVEADQFLDAVVAGQLGRPGLGDGCTGGEVQQVGEELQRWEDAQAMVVSQGGGEDAIRWFRSRDQNLRWPRRGLFWSSHQIASIPESDDVVRSADSNEGTVERPD